MSTREKGGTEPAVNPPEELRVLGGLLPANGATPTTGAPSPGVALAGARLPGGPTLPDWDPSGFAVIAARLANELFSAPPAASAPEPSSVPAASTSERSSVPAAPAPALSSVPAAPASAPTAAPLSSQAQAPSGANPFFAPLSFASLEAHEPGALAASFSLLDTRPGSPLDAGHAVSAGTEAPAPPASAAPAYELQPVTGLTLGSFAGTGLDPHAIRREFPILQERVHGKHLVWLDNAATTQKPRAVIDRLTHFYEHENSNIHRAAHTLAARATDAYEKAREAVRRFVNASSVQEIIFVRGTTEGINLIAQTYGRRNIGEGDEIVVTHLEHHANIVPWQMLCAEKGARLRVAPVDDRGEIILEEYEKLLGPRTRLVSMTQVSNALGTVTPAREMIEMAHRHGARVVLDGAQSVSHMRVDVQQLDCDFLVFSGHKVFAPTGIGAVFGKHRLLEAMPPWQGGGNMIQDVTFERTVYQGPPARFEAGTGNIADAVGLGAAIDWLTRVGVENVGRYEHELLAYATPRLAEVPGLTLIGTAREKAGVLSFVLAGKKTEEVGGMLDKEGIAVRSGHHCAQPILRRFGLEATVRASLAPYNTCEDIDTLVDALHRIQSGQR
jgi:cysteine desulfurase/selenocysteine lyase